MTKTQAIHYAIIQCENLGVDFIEVESYSKDCIEYAYLEDNQECSDIIYL